MTEKPSRNEDEYFVRREAELLKQRRVELMESQAEAERRTHYMKCPKDGFSLETRTFHGVAVDTCTHCGGMWLDAGELELISRHEDHRGLLGRVFGDVMASLRPHRGEHPLETDTPRG
jgi:uncharacterized protein